MKYRIEFEVSDEEYDRLAKIMQGEELFAAVNEYDQYLRAEVKYKDNATAQPYREKLWEILRERGVEDLL